MDMEGYYVGIDEDAGAYDSTHDDHGGVEEVQAPGQGGGGVGQGREDNKARQGSKEVRK